MFGIVVRRPFWTLTLALFAVASTGCYMGGSATWQHDFRREGERSTNASSAGNIHDAGPAPAQEEPRQQEQ